MKKLFGEQRRQFLLEKIKTSTQPLTGGELAALTSLSRQVIVGAFLGGWLLSPLFGTGTINSDDFSISSLLVSFLGAVILLAIVNLLRRGRVR